MSTANTPQSPVSPADSTRSLGPTPEQFQRYARNQIYLLRASLPPQLYQECCERLGRGQPPLRVARWLRSRADAGPLRNYSEHSLRRYLGALGREVRSCQAATPAASAQAVEVKNQAERVLDKLARDGRKVLTFEDVLGDWKGEFDIKVALEATMKRIFCTWQWVREEMAALKDKNLPWVNYVKAEVKLALALAKVADVYFKLFPEYRARQDARGGVWPADPRGEVLPMAATKKYTPELSAQDRMLIREACSGLANMNELITAAWKPDGREAGK